MGPVPQPEEDRDHPSHNEHEIEDAEHPDVMINVDISDSDDDDNDDDAGYSGYIGYQALAQDVGPAGLDTSSESDQEEETAEDVHTSGNNGISVIEDIDGGMECEVPEGLVHQVRHPEYPNTSNLPGYMQVPDLPRPDRKDMLWNQERHPDTSTETDDTDKIMSVMSNIKLPTSNIPDWAKTLSDDQWQLQVVNKLRLRTSQKNNSELNKETSQVQDSSET